MYIDNYAVLKAGGMSAESVYEIISKDGVRLSGRLNDMQQRALVYHHLYTMSDGNFTLPLIAAHGALWARWYLFFAKFGAHALAIFDTKDKASYRDKIRSYHEYMNALKNINCIAMAANYTAFHFTRLYGDHELMSAKMPKRLVTFFLHCHQLSKTGAQMSASEQRLFYEDYFRWEQDNIVGPAMSNALNEFDWPLAKKFCQRPWVWFSYFHPWQHLKFNNFANTHERTQKGMAIFDWAAKKSWSKVEANLLKNPFFPRRLTFDANTYLADLGMTPITAP